MSIFDKENIVTKEYLISKGFQKDYNISSPYSEDNRYVFQIRGRYDILLANIFYYLDPHEFQDQYHFYIGYRDVDSNLKMKNKFFKAAGILPASPLMSEE